MILAAPLLEKGSTYILRVLWLTVGNFQGKPTFSGGSPRTDTPPVFFFFFFLLLCLFADSLTHRKPPYGCGCQNQWDPILVGIGEFTAHFRLPMVVGLNRSRTHWGLTGF